MYLTDELEALPWIIPSASSDSLQDRFRQDFPGVTNGSEAFILKVSQALPGVQSSCADLVKPEAIGGQAF